MAKICRLKVVTLLLVKLAVVSGSGELGNCVYAVNVACETVTSNNRGCQVVCETAQQIGKKQRDAFEFLKIRGI